MTDYALPVLIGFIIVYALVKKVNVFDCFIEGGREGLRTAVNLAPTLIGLLVAVNMLTASGAFDLLSRALAPAAAKMGFPAEVVPLFALRPFSGSGALAVFENLIQQYGPDSVQGRVASVIMGSTETTFYATAVYFGAVGVTNSRHTIPCALLADFSSFVLAVTMVNLGI